MLERRPVPRNWFLSLSLSSFRSGGTVFHPINILTNGCNVYPIVGDVYERLLGCACAQLADHHTRNVRSSSSRSKLSASCLSHNRGRLGRSAKTPTPHRQIGLSRLHATRSPMFSRIFVPAGPDTPRLK